MKSAETDHPRGTTDLILEQRKFITEQCRCSKAWVGQKGSDSSQRLGLFPGRNLLCWFIVPRCVTNGLKFVAWCRTELLRVMHGNWFIPSNKACGSPRDRRVEGRDLSHHYSHDFLLCSVLPGYENQVGFGTPVYKRIDNAVRIAWLC